MKKIICALLALALTALLALPALAAPPLLVDEAGLLSESEAAALEEKLAALSAQWKNDIVIVTVDSTGGASPEAFADDWFDYGGYGQGESYDGLLLLLDMDTRDWHISTCGGAIDAFTDAGIEFLGKRLIADGLSDGEYAAAFNGFADWCGQFLARAETGRPYDRGSLPRTAGDYAKILLLGLGGGLLIAFLFTGSMKKKLRTVRRKQQAADYLRPGSLQLAYANEQLLFRNVTRTLRNSDTPSSGGGGSTTHKSSSGRSHGGGGGKF
ncbi:MAG: TPM domain-containing protein [Oscillospiraceae bacterium]|nr:TPM domain-containing protein [Oscillospiraceae bacterium]